MATLEKNQMLSLAENAVNLALKNGAQDAEAYLYDGQATNIGIELGQISKTNKIIDHGLGIRVSLNKAIGFAYTNILDDPNAIEKAIINALSAAKASKPDPDWKGLPQKQPFNNIEGTFDNKILELQSEDLVNLAAVMLDAAGNVNKKVFPIEGGVGNAYISSALVNSNGISAFDKGTVIECSLAAVAKEGNTVTPACFEFNAARNYEVNPEWIGKKQLNWQFQR